MKFHPEGVASLIAVIVAPEDVEAILASKRAAQFKLTKDEAIRRAIDIRRSQILRLARAYYKINPQDYASSNENWRVEYARNGLQNLARLDRKNLR
jgi:hypothetical protein